MLTQALASADETLSGARVWDHLAATAAERGRDIAALIRQFPEEQTHPPARVFAANRLTLADVESLPPRGVSDLVKALQEELPAFLRGTDFNSRLRIKDGAFEIAWLRDPGGSGASRDLERIPVLVLDATPVPRLVDWVTQGHRRLPDVRGMLTVPANVNVVQYARSSNGFRSISSPERVPSVMNEIEVERLRFPCATESEALVTYRGAVSRFDRAGFARVMTYGAIRGSNQLQDVRRLHLVGRPNPPPHETYFLAQVLHHDEEAVSPQAFFVERRYAGTSWGIEVVDYADPRMAALLFSAREAEMFQVLHRARLFVRDDPVTVVLHTSHPVPGVRVDRLELSAPSGPPVNRARHDDASQRLNVARAELERRGEPITGVALALEAKASRRTAYKYLRELGEAGRATNQLL